MAKAAFQFTPATKKQSYARVALVGPPGSGKTYSALRIMRGLSPNDRIAVIDTERGSASKYSGSFAFDVLELPSFEPDTYVAALASAAEAGYLAVIVDSLSHAWVGRGGALEQVDRRAGQGSSFNAWRDVTPMHNRLVESLLTYPGHVIATMRVKTEYVVDQVVKGGKTISVPRKVGLAPVQRDGLEYEFDVVGDVDQEHSWKITKTRCEALDNAYIEKPGEEVGETLRAWLTDGAPIPAPIVKAAADGPGKLPAQQPSTTSKPASAAPPVQPFDLVGVKGRIAMAESKDEATDIAARAGIADQPDDVKAQVRIAIRARAAEIERERAAAATAPETEPPAQDAAPAHVAPEPTPGPTPAAEPDRATDPAPAADPGWTRFLADIEKSVGDDTSQWSEGDAINAWDYIIAHARDVQDLDAQCLPWLTASRKRGGSRVAGIRSHLDSAYKARRADLAKGPATGVAA